MTSEEVFTDLFEKAKECIANSNSPLQHIAILVVHINEDLSAKGAEVLTSFGHGIPEFRYLSAVLTKVADDEAAKPKPASFAN